MILYTVWLQKLNFTDEQYYEIFNTKVDVGEAIGIKIQHPLLISHTKQGTIYIFLPLFQMKSGIMKKILGKVPLINFTSEKWNATKTLREDLQIHFTIGVDQ